MAKSSVPKAQGFFAGKRRRRRQREQCAVAVLCQWGDSWYGKDAFSKRLTELRLAKNISARDVSLSLGQSPGYINNIEKGINYPSMTIFFYICDYFGITPEEFFVAENKDPVKTRALLSAVKGLNPDQMDRLIAIAKDLQRK